MHPIFDTTGPALLVEMVKTKNSALSDMSVVDVSFSEPAENTNGAINRNTVVLMTRENAELPMRESEQIFYDRLDIASLFSGFNVGTEYDSDRLAAVGVSDAADVALLIADLNGRFDINLSDTDFDFTMTMQGAQPYETTIAAKSTSLKFIGELVLFHHPLD